MRPALLAVVLSCAGCTVPPLSDVVGGRLLQCDDAGGCLPNYVCIEGCQPASGAPCDQSGLVVDCGRSLGECKQGKIECDGKHFGSCLGATPPMPEKCGTGLDEDCDGLIDELPDGGLCP